MVDTVRTRSALQTLLADNTSGAITPQMIRDLMASGMIVSSGSGKPGSAPASGFELYFDTTNLIWYVATGVSTAADWKLLGPKKWRLVDSAGAFTTVAAYTGATVATFDIVGLAGWEEVRPVFRGLTASSSGTRQMLVSINNGSSFLTTNGDYIAVSAAGVESNATSFGLTSGVNTTAQTSFIHIPNFSETVPKIVSLGRSDAPLALLPTANALNAIRFQNSAGNLNGGSIYVWVR